jgi:polysaccharide deacetylase 2 family uncharacterized protein YibQ
MSAFLGVLRQRGLAFFDDGVARRRPGAWSRASADTIVDETQSPAAIIADLRKLEDEISEGLTKLEAMLG